MNTIREYPWQHVPLLRTLIPFIAGIILFLNFPDIPLIIQVGVSVTFTILYLILTIYQHKIPYSRRYLPGIFFSLAFLSLGYFYSQSRQQIIHPSHFSKFINKNSLFVVRINEIPLEKEKTIKCNVKVKYVIEADTIHKVQGKSIFYFSKDSLSKTLKYGDYVLIKSRLNELEEPLNPGQFNYKRFLMYKRIYQQAFIKQNNWVLLDSFHPSSVNGLITFRKKILNQLDSLISNPDESAIASALLVGYKEELSDAVKASFSSTGAMHVLAVSGLHVGIIFLLFNSLLKPFKRGRYGHYLVMIILLTVIWAYAILTGMSPSVFRASTMFSFVIVGQNLKRVTNIYSSILASLLILLITDPFMISQVGFQLSYIAVIGIVAIQPMISRIWQPRRWLVKKIWAIMAVSLAAQISTFPLAIFYFNQFPVYFFISNLIVIPAAMLIIVLGIIYLFFAFITSGVLSTFSGFLLKIVIHALNISILQIQKFPGGLIREIYLNEAGLVMVYLTIIFLVLFVIRKKKHYLALSLVAMVLFIAGHIGWNIKNHLTKRWVIYAVPGHSLTGFFSGKQAVFFGDNEILNDSTTLKYNTFRDLWHQGIKADEVVKIGLDSSYQNSFIKIQDGLIQFYEKIIYFPLSKVTVSSIQTHLKPDYFILNQHSFIIFDTLTPSWDNKIILDSSFPWYRSQYISNVFEKSGTSYFNIAKDGALILTQTSNKLWIEKQVRDIYQKEFAGRNN